MRLFWPAVLVCCVVTLSSSQEHPTNNQPTATQSAPRDQPKVFITDSQSWETFGSAGGSGGNWGAETHGGARPQTAEIIKTFGERCSEVTINNKLSAADYIVVLDHEGGKGALRHKNKVAVFEKLSGDAVMSHSTLSLGGSVQDACEGIVKHWAQHSAEIRAGEAKEAAAHSVQSPAVQLVPVVASASPKLAVASTPEGADIEVDGSFVGNTPSSIEVAPGEHVVVVKKPGYKDWTRKLKVSGGDIRLSPELEKTP